MGNVCYKWKYLSWSKEDLEEIDYCYKFVIWKNFEDNRGKVFY